MKRFKALERPLRLNWQGLYDNILRKGTPDRVYHIELFQDYEISDAIARRYRLLESLTPGDPLFEQKRYIAVQRYCGFDYVRAGMADFRWPLFGAATEDTAALAHAGGRRYQDEHNGPIQNWEQFEKYPWPDPRLASATRLLEWYQANLPDDMCIIASGGFGHLAEMLTWLMGYETLCLSLYDQRDLVAAIARRLSDFYIVCLERILQFDRVKLVWGSDDLGFKTGLMISPADTREFVLSGHRRLAAVAHAAGRPYLLHACGKLTDIMEDLIRDVKIDARHSFEDVIEDVITAKRLYGGQIAVLGGIDVDFLCRADEKAIRRRVCQVLDACQPGGGYCLGTGNSVTNYIPLENYLTMLDEGRRYGT